MGDISTISPFDQLDPASRRNPDLGHPVVLACVKRRRVAMTSTAIQRSHPISSPSH
jgi:hypothetical protein